MKKTFYIIGGVIIVILIAIWLFLLFADDSTKTDVYNRFGLTGNNEEGIIENVIDVIVPDFLQKKYLRQLTTKRVIGYTEVSEASSTLVYFVERGTGHVYTIDPMIEGSENRVSNITVPVSTEASLSKDGSRIAVRTGNQTDSNITILTKNDDSFDSFTPDMKVRDFTFSEDGTLLYTQMNISGLEGRALDISAKTSRNIFILPFNEATILWGADIEGPHFLYPKTSRYLEGYLYQVKNRNFSRLPASGFGLSGKSLNDSIIYSKLNDGKYTSFVLKKEKSDQLELPSAFIPEKCASGKNIYCAYAGTPPQEYDFPDNWYRGETSFSDTIWNISEDTSWIYPVINTKEESGRELDIIDMSVVINDSMLYFTNKNDRSLWVYEFPKEDNQE